MKNLQIATAPSRRHRLAGEMFPLVELWLQSDLTQPDFCREHGLSVSILAYWLRKYRDEQSGPEKAGSFVALSVLEVSTKPIEVIYPNGVRVQLSGGAGARFIREIAGQC